MTARAILGSGFALISVQNVSKRYDLHRTAAAKLLHATGLRRDSSQEFWALRDISFEVAPGEAVALIGPNGSGKSTLLQVISGILQPTLGRVLCAGRVAALLELGAGFNPEFTGRENVYLNGEILGLTRREIDAAFPSIQAFAEIGAFMDRPVKEYSTGMYVRLAFSTAIHVEPDVLIVDEALSVGDAIFASRCIHKFEELRQQKVTVLLVSHDLGLVKRLADRAIFLLGGKMVLDGTPKEAVNRYVGFVLERENKALVPQEEKAPQTPAQFRHGDGTSRINSVKIVNAADQETRAFQRGDLITVRVEVEFLHPADNPVVGLLIRNRIGMDVFGTNTRIEGVPLGSFERGERVEVDFEMECLFARQEYTLTVASQHPDGLSQDWLDDVLEFSVIDTKDLAGVLNLSPKIAVRCYR